MAGTTKQTTKNKLKLTARSRELNCAETAYIYRQ